MSYVSLVAKGLAFNESLMLLIIWIYRSENTKPSIQENYDPIDEFSESERTEDIKAENNLLNILSFAFNLNFDTIAIVLRNSKAVPIMRLEVCDAKVSGISRVFLLSFFFY